MDVKKRIRRVLLRLHGQRPLVLLLAVLVGMTMALGSTYAWFTSSDEVRNQFGTSDLSFSFQVVEKFTNPGTVGPGQGVEKKVNVTNAGTQKGVVRVLALPEIMAQDGRILEAAPGVTFAYDGLNVTDGFDDGKLWADGGDGYYYYLGALECGETTMQPLFTGVTLASGLPAEYENAGMKIYVKAEAAETGKYRTSWWKTADDSAYPADPQWLRIDAALQAALGNQ